jgi:hypothetical protein
VSSFRPVSREAVPENPAGQSACDPLRLDLGRRVKPALDGSQITCSPQGELANARPRRQSRADYRADCSHLGETDEARANEAGQTVGSETWGY